MRLVLSPQVEETVRATGSCLMAGKTGKEEYARLLGGTIRDRRRKRSRSRRGSPPSRLDGGSKVGKHR